MRKVTLKGLMARKLRLGLTALAIVLGVAFVTGTLVLGDTLNRSVANLVATAYKHVDFEIHGRQTLRDAGNSGVDSTKSRRAVPQALAARVRALRGVQSAEGVLKGYAQLVAPNGHAIGSSATASGYSWDPNPQLSTFRLAAGKAPTTGDQVVIDKHTATKYGIAIGDRVGILLPNGHETFTVSGIITFGSADSLANSTLASFYLPTVQKLFNSVGYYDSIDVLVKPGANKVTVQREIAKILPTDMQVVSGQTIANQLNQTIQSQLSFLTLALLAFAFISLLVGSFTIFNTFSITVGQRTRELALLRVVGASRAQLFNSVLTEGALTGMVASLIGLGLGVVAALGLKALLGAFGVALPSAPLVFEARTPAVALVVGIGVTTLSATIPARRAIRIPPVAALVDQQSDQPETLRRRLIIGAGAGILGLLLLVSGLANASITSVGLGALSIFIATVVLVPTIAAPLASLLGRPLARTLGIAGRLGRRNSARNPRRTAQTAGALMIGVALVSTITVLASSVSASATSVINQSLAADYIITGSDSISPVVATTIGRLPGVTATTALYNGQFDVRGSLESLSAVSSPGLDRNLNLKILAGQGVAAITRGELLVESNTAHTEHLRVGSIVPVTFAQTGNTTMRVAGIYNDNGLVGDYLTGASYFLAHFNHPLIDTILASTAPGARNFEATLKHVLRPYPTLTIKTRAQYEQSVQNSINQLLDLIYALLALAVLIAMIGIVNTLMLSVFERTREIGLLRAVGMQRDQVRWMVRSESVIIAVLGAAVGIVTGTGLGLALSSSLRNSGVTSTSVPVGTLISFLVAAAVLGLAAASWPARRAAKLDVLTAIATE